MKITDPKLVYNEFKYFKGVYTILNKCKTLRFSSVNKHLYVDFLDCPDSQFFILRGELLDESEFTKWLKQSNGQFFVSLTDLNLIAKCLKKNAIEISFDDNFFEYSFLDADGNTKIITFKKEEYCEDEKIKNICSKFIKKYELSEKLVSREVCELFVSNEELTDSHTGVKILEIPSKRILALQKTNNKLELDVSDINEDVKFVRLKSYSDSMILEQIFATV